MHDMCCRPGKDIFRRNLVCLGRLLISTSSAAPRTPYISDILLLKPISAAVQLGCRAKHGAVQEQQGWPVRYREVSCLWC
jgi:hypothetical protein